MHDVLTGEMVPSSHSYPGGRSWPALQITSRRRAKSCSAEPTPQQL